jgi:dihydroflavonol-4-reductase
LSKKIVITGISGLVGLALAKKYKQAGWQVTGTIQKGSIVSEELMAFQIFEGDIKDELFLEEVFRGTDLIIHTAAVVSFDRRDKKIMYRTNVLGTKAVVDVCLSLKTPKLVYISSVAAFGRNLDSGVINEQTQWENSDLNTNYAHSKFLAELEFWRGMEEGLNGYCVHPSIVLGCGDISKSSNTIFTNLFKTTIFYIDGSVNVVDLRDVVECVYQLDQKEINHQKYILNAHSVSVKELFSYFAKYKSAKLRNASTWMVYLAWALNGIYGFFANKRSKMTLETIKVMKAQSKYDNAKITNELGFSFRDLPETMSHCISYYVEKYTL